MSQNETDPPRPGRKRIVVIDDHELMRIGLVKLISEQGDWEIAGQAADGPSAMALLREVQPDVALVDLRLQRGDGIELIKQIRASVPDVHVLVVSMQDEELYAERTLRAGGMGFVSKEAPAATLLNAIERVGEGKVYLSPRMLERVLSRRGGRRITGAQSRLDLLSDREMEVFERFGRGMSAKEIAQELHLSAKTVEYHRQHIKEKLQVATSAAVVRLATVYSLGLSSSPF